MTHPCLRLLFETMSDESPIGGQFQRRSLWHGRKETPKAVALGMEGGDGMGRKTSTE
jgi:hypothetical protein